jgi:exonuclease SbcC
MDKSYLELYLEYKDYLASLTADNQFYDELDRAIDTGVNKYSLFNRYFEKKIDLDWVEEIEACIIPLDNIIRVPRKFIVQEEEIVPIERARKITNESIRHLAQHTNMIAKVEGDDVTPNEILNVFREESFEVYENRFVFTLMQNLIRFIDVRYNVIFNISDDDNMSSIKMESDFERGREKVSYKLEMSTQSGGGELEDNDVGLNGENATAFQRIERVKRIINEYAHSSFMRELQNCVPVRPPIMRTNAIQKNPNFRACLKLWQFIQSYRELGYEITVKESNDMVSEEYRDQLNKMISMNYMMLKANTLSEDAVGKQKKRKLKPRLLKRLAEELVIDYDMEDVEIQRVFVDEMKRVRKKKIDGEKKIQDAIQRALDSENARKKAIEDKIKAKIAHEKEMERRRIEREREKARIAREKEKERKAKEREREKARKAKELALAKEKAKKEREKARIAKEKEKEKARIAKEKELARIQKEKEHAEKLKAAEEARVAKEKQREQMRIAKEKAIKLARIEKEKAIKAKQKEKERQAKALEAQKAKEKAQAAKQKEKEAIEIARAAQAEKDRIAKEKAKEKAAKEKAEQLEKERLAKEKEKEKAAKEKAAQLEKENIAKEKAKEKAAKDKAVQAEKERIAKEKAKEKDRLAKEAAAQKAKEKAQAAKQKELEALAKAKAIQAEKDRIAKEKAKEKERSAKDKAALAEKEARAKAKEKEKERIIKLRAAQAEKARADKEKAKEKERIAKEKAKEREKIAREKAKEKERLAREKAKSKKPAANKAKNALNEENEDSSND